MLPTLKDYKILKEFSVSRETISNLVEFIALLMEKNKEINLISKNSCKNIWQRHVIDSVQIIDLIDKNSKICTDLGSGGGFPGIVLAIIMKGKKVDMKFKLYEKSFYKCKFLKDVSKNFNLNAEIIKKDILKEKELKTGTVLARAFKPLPIILELLNNNFTDFKNLVVFMGKNGKETVNDASKAWNFEYKKIMSVTAENSFLLNVKNIKKKI